MQYWRTHGNAPQVIDWDEQEFAEARPGIFGATVHTPSAHRDPLPLRRRVELGGAPAPAGPDHPGAAGRDRLRRRRRARAPDGRPAGDPAGRARRTRRPCPDDGPAVTLNVFTHREAPPECLIGWVSTASGSWWPVARARSVARWSRASWRPARRSPSPTSAAARCAGLTSGCSASIAADLSDAGGRPRRGRRRARASSAGSTSSSIASGINDRRPIEELQRRRLGPDHRRQPDERLSHRDRGRGRDARAGPRPDRLLLVGRGAQRPQAPRSVCRDQGGDQPADARDRARVRRARA